MGGSGAVIAVVTVGGGGLRAVDQDVFATGEGPADAAWNDWRGEPGDGPLNLIRPAIVASNAHDAQPCLVGMYSTSIDLFADPIRGTGANDPLDRELAKSFNMNRYQSMNQFNCDQAGFSNAHNSLVKRPGNVSSGVRFRVFA